MAEKCQQQENSDDGLVSGCASEKLFGGWWTIEIEWELGTALIESPG